MAYLERKVRVRSPCDIAFKPNKTRNKARSTRGGRDGPALRACAGADDRGRCLRPKLALATDPRHRALRPRGGAIDIVSRTVAQQLSLQLGYPIVIESRPGAGGVIGTAAVAKADPDGHTILLTASSHTISPWAYSNLPYDTVGDLAGITPLANLPNVLVVAPSANIRSAQALAAAAARQAGRSQLCIRRKRLRDPSQCRTVSSQRRV